MFVDNSFAKNNVERKEKIYINSVAIVVGAVNMWNSPDSPENTGVQTPFEWLKRLSMMPIERNWYLYYYQNRALK